MGKLKYHIKGIGKNKEIKAERKKPLPLSLMKDKYETIRARIDGGRDEKGVVYC